MKKLLISTLWIFFILLFLYIFIQFHFLVELPLLLDSFFITIMLFLILLKNGSLSRMKYNAKEILKIATVFLIGCIGNALVRYAAEAIIIEIIDDILATCLSFSFIRVLLFCAVIIFTLRVLCNLKYRFSLYAHVIAIIYIPIDAMLIYNEIHLSSVPFSDAGLETASALDLINLFAGMSVGNLTRYSNMLAFITFYCIACFLVVKSIENAALAAKTEE